MTGGSLRLRLLLVGVAGALVLPLLAAAGLRAAFEHHVEAATTGELEADLRYLTRSLRLAGSAVLLEPVALPDPRFGEPLSGLYWQIEDDASGAVVRSGSLVTFTIRLPDDELPQGAIHRHELAGPDGARLLLLERRIPDGPDQKRGWRFAVAVDRALLDRQADAFLSDLVPVLLLLSAGLLGLSLVQGAITLAPLRRARTALAGVRAGRRSRLAGSFPQELDVIAQDFDALLDTAEAQARAARERAADLAHALRTPLAVLMARAAEAETAGQAAIAASIREIVAELDGRAARDLARASIQGPLPGRTTILPLAPAIGRIVGALSRTPGPRALSWTVEIDPAHAVRMEAGDLTELAGCLLDNAGKWAARQVRVASRTRDSRLILTVEDDGPGIAPHQRRIATARGTRLDPERSGTGLGLSIASEIARAYGGTLDLEDSTLGGLCVTVVLAPQAGAATGTGTV